MSDYCCDKFKENVDDEQFERLDAGGWAINGCCGGGCYVVCPMTHCPFCGTELTKTDKPN